MCNAKCDTKSSFISAKPAYLSENLKMLTSYNFHRAQYLLLKFCTCFVLNIVYKRVFRIFFVLFRSWVVKKKVKNFVSVSMQKPVLFIFANISKSKQNFKKSKHPFVDIDKQENLCKISGENILNSMIVGACWSI